MYVPVHYSASRLTGGATGTFNIRGGDVPYNPVMISFGLVTQDAAYLYADERKIDEEVRKHLGDIVKVLPYEQIFEDLKALDNQNKVDSLVTVLVSDKTCAESVD